MEKGAVRKKTLTFCKFLCVGVCIVLCTSVSAADSIVGIWDSVNRSEGGIGNSLMFTKDGYVYVQHGALINYRYEVNGNDLILDAINPQDEANQKNVMPFVFEGDRLIFYPEDKDKRQDLTRDDGDKSVDSKLVGKWSYQDESLGAKGLMQFTSTGLCRLSIPFPGTKEWSYSLDNHVLTMTAGKESPQVYNITIGDNQLILLPMKGKEEKKYTKWSVE